MQNKNALILVKKQTRRLHERIGALVLIFGVLASAAAMSDDARRVLSGLAMRPAFAVLEHAGKENETARHPVRLDSVLRAPSVSGS